MRKATGTEKGEIFQEPVVKQFTWNKGEVLGICRRKLLREDNDQRQVKEPDLIPQALCERLCDHTGRGRYSMLKSQWYCQSAVQP